MVYERTFRQRHYFVMRHSLVLRACPQPRLEPRTIVCGIVHPFPLRTAISETTGLFQESVFGPANSEPVLGGVQLINIRDDVIAVGIINKLKARGVFTAITAAN
jgi:hypothetical protein